MAKAKPNQSLPPKDYAEAFSRLNGREKVFQPDGKMIIDYGRLTSLGHDCNAIIVVEGGVTRTIYWQDGAVEHVNPEK